MQVRWWLGTVFLAVPTGLSFSLFSATTVGNVLVGRQLREHIAMAWSIGCLMSYLAETYRRQTFANHKLAAAAAARELNEAKQRILIQADLSRVQREAASRLVLVEREKAANDAKVGIYIIHTYIQTDRQTYIYIYLCLYSERERERERL